MDNKQDKQNNTPITLEEVKNTIPELIEEFCIKNKIDDLHKESNNIFMACLLYINKSIIEPNKKELLKTPHNTNNKYDINKIDLLLDIFINLCMSYDATVTITAFSCFSGLDHDTICNLQHDVVPHDQYNNITKTLHKADPQGKTGFGVWQKLMKYEEITTLNCRKYNDLRIIARLNRITGGAYRDYTQVDTAQTRPQLSTSDIENKYGIAENVDNMALLPPTE